MNAPPVDGTMLAGRTVCLVTSGHVGSNPRSVKEADALVRAGAQVHVVAVDVTKLPEVQERDDFVLGRGLWPCVRVDRGGPIRAAFLAATQRAARATYSLGIRTDRVVRWAYDPLIASLGRAAAARPADLYVAHNLAALPAAHDAATRHNARLGFDAEDFHSGQFADTAENAAALRLTRHIERRYLPLCDYVTAASPAIGRAYAAAYALQQPVTVLNVFPTRDAPERPTAGGTATHSPSLYWFSQTIGPSRGLEQTLAAIAASRSRPWLYLQGTVSPGFERHLKELAGSLGLGDHVVFLPPALPDELPRVASRHDAGLAVELEGTANRDACLSNKVFTYLLAGVPVLATDTTAQGELAAQVPDAMRILPLTDHEQWPAVIDALLLQPEQLAAARAAAWKAAQNRFNWEHEQQAFVQVVARTLRPRSGIESRIELPCQGS